MERKIPFLLSFIHHLSGTLTTAGTPAVTKHCEDRGHTLEMRDQSTERSQILENHEATILVLDYILQDDFCIYKHLSFKIFVIKSVYICYKQLNIILANK